MKITCTAEEKERFIEGVSCDANEDCPLGGLCFGRTCRECLEVRITWEIKDGEQE